MSIANIRAGFDNFVGESVRYVSETAKRCNELRLNTDFFQKISILGKGCIELANELRGTLQLGKLVKALDATYVSDFFGGIPVIHAWLKPINVNSVHANALLKKVIDVYEQDRGRPTNEDVRDVMKGVLEQFMNDLGNKEKGNQFGYATSAQFLGALHNRLNQFYEIAAQDFIDEVGEVPLHSVSVGDWLRNSAFHYISGATVVYYLREWNLLDTAKWAASIGSVPGFGWVNKIDFQLGFESAILFAFGVAFVESARKFISAIRQDPARPTIGPDAKSNAKWDAISAAAEAVFYGIGISSVLGFITKNPVVVALSLIAAKLIGSLKIATRRHNLFDTPAPLALAPIADQQPSLATRVKTKVRGLIAPIAQQKHIALVTGKIAGMADKVKSAVIWVFDGLNELVSLDGFDRLYKFIFPIMKLADKYHFKAPVLEKCRKTFELHKDMIYASKIFGSISDWTNMKKDRDDKHITPFHELDKATGQRKLNIPKGLIKTLYDISNIFETTKFLRKYEIYSFDYFVKVGANLAEWQIPVFGCCVKDIPLLKAISSSPKSICVGLAAGLDVGLQLKDGLVGILQGDHAGFTWERLCHLVSNIGKVILVTWEATSSFGFNVVELITGSAGLCKYWIAQNKKREAFAPPVLAI